jgi:uncharacterized protein YggE
VISQVERQVFPDLMTWSVGAQAQARRDLDRAVAAARAFLLAHGIFEIELTIGPVRESHEPYTETVLYRTLEVTSADVERAGRAYRAIEAAGLDDVEHGAGPSCSAAATPIVEQEALSAARAQARLRAARAILDYGGVPGPIVDADEGRADANGECPVKVTATAIAKYEID